MGSGYRLLRGFQHCGEEEGEPLFPITLKPDFLEQIIVGRPVLFEIQREV
jgi:hypothetical protein